MFRYSDRVKLNKPIHSLLNNGLVYSLVSAQGAILKSTPYRYQLTTMQKVYPRSSIVETKSLLTE